MTASYDSLLRLLSVRRHEAPAAALGFLYFFCLLSAYYVMRPLRDQLAAAAGGSASLPVMYIATMIATLALTPVFGKLVARLPRRQFVAAVNLFFIFGALAFVPLYGYQEAIGARTLGAIFFVWVSVFNLFVVALFWSFMADLFAPEQARRLFPVIAVGGVIGAIAGPAFTRATVVAIGVPGLMATASLLLFTTLLCVRQLSRWSRANPVAAGDAREERIIGGSMFAGLLMTLKSPLMRRMAGVMLLGDCVGTVIYALLLDHVHATIPDPGMSRQFLATLDLHANVLQIVLQLTITRWLMIRGGPAWVMVLDATIKTVMLAAIAVGGIAYSVTAVVATRASMYGVFKIGADALYTRVASELRYKSKSFIDTAVWRFGDVVITSSMNLLRAVGMTVPGFALLSIVAAVSSGWVGWHAVHSPELERETPPDALAGQEMKAESY